MLKKSLVLLGYTVFLSACTFPANVQNLFPNNNTAGNLEKTSEPNDPLKNMFANPDSETSDQMEKDDAKNVSEQSSTELMFPEENSPKSDATMPADEEKTVPPEVASEEAPSTENTTAVEQEQNASDLSGKIVIYEDYECPFCRNFEREAIAPLREKHPQVEITIRQFPLPIHAHAYDAAKYAICSGEQGKFAPMNAALFAAADLSTTGLEQIAADLELEKTVLETCLENPTTTAHIDADIAAGKAAGVRGTPTFFVNGTMFEGAYPLENIEKALRDSQ